VAQGDSYAGAPQSGPTPHLRRPRASPAPCTIPNVSDDQPTAPPGGQQPPSVGATPEPIPDVVRSGAHPPSAGEGVFGLDPVTAPGDVPWGTRQVVFATVVAAGPIVALTVLSLVMPQQGDQNAQVTTFAAAFMVAVTVLVDGWFAFWAWFYSLRRWHLPAASLGLRRPAKRIFWLVPAALVAVYVVNLAYEALYQALSGHATPPQEIVDSFPHSAAGVVLFAILAVVVAPFFEEVVFRGFLFQGLASSFGLVPGVVVSAAVFGAIHGQLTVVVPLFVLGVALAWVFHSAKSLWACIALHAVFNGISVLVWALSGG
jgi:uncharacterized protein